MGLLARALTFRAVSDASTLANPRPWMASLFGGGPSSAGPTVNENTALGIPTVWACVRTIAEDVAKLPIRVGSTQADGSKQLMPDSMMSWLLNRQPNGDMSAFTLRETLTAHALLWGNGFAEIERDGAGRPIGLWVLRPDRMTIFRGDDGKVWYRYSSNTKTVEIPGEDILHLKGMGFDGLVGYSVVRYARESLGMTIAAQQYGSTFFKNAARPSGVLESPQKLNEKVEENLKKSFKQMYQGSDNAGSVPILWDGFTFKAISIPPNDAQFLESRKFQRREICAWFRMKPHKIGDLEDATFSNIEQENLSYVTDCLDAWLMRWEQEIAIKLFGPRQSSMFAQHNTAALLRGDLKSRYEAYAIGRQWGFRSVNDIRRLENENPIGTEGDQYLVPSNMTTPEKLGQAPPPSVTGKLKTGSVSGEGAARAIGNLLAGDSAEVTAKLFKIEADRAMRAHKRGELATWSKAFYTEHFDHVRSQIFPVAERFALGLRVCGIEVPETFVPTFVADSAREYIQHQTRAIDENIDKPWETLHAAVWGQQRASLLACALIQDRISMVPSLTEWLNRSTNDNADPKADPSHSSGR